ncbi:MAG TPA: hypothetical protein PKZ97_19530 [Azospirillaceae bacterium]|nr:hypothetical protein [Azospirillaceae bacterium]
MGMLDFLKINVKKAPPKKKGPPKAPNNWVQIDSKSFPLGAITPAGFVATGFDGSLIKGQNAKLIVSVDDQFANFNFAVTVIVIDVAGDKLTGQFGMLPPETETLIRKYAQLRKQKAGK